MTNHDTERGANLNPDATNALQFPADSAPCGTGTGMTKGIIYLTTSRENSDA